MGAESGSGLTGGEGYNRGASLKGMPATKGSIYRRDGVRGAGRWVCGLERPSFKDSQEDFILPLDVCQTCFFRSRPNLPQALLHNGFFSSLKIWRKASRPLMSRKSVVLACQSPNRWDYLHSLESKQLFKHLLVRAIISRSRRRGQRCLTPSGWARRLAAGGERRTKKEKKKKDRLSSTMREGVPGGKG